MRRFLTASIAAIALAFIPPALAQDGEAEFDGFQIGAATSNLNTAARTTRTASTITSALAAI